MDQALSLVRATAQANPELSTLDLLRKAAECAEASRQVLQPGCECWYRLRSGERQLATVLKVHYDDVPPYYTIRVAGHERETVRERLEQEGSGSAAAPEQAAPDGGASSLSQRLSSEANALFARLDLDGDGAITTRELAAHLQSPDAPAFARSFRRVIDLDDDGVIDLQEFRIAYRCARSLLTTGSSADQIFDTLDRNGDGVISRQELLARLGPGPSTDRLFDSFDQNADGAIDIHEFRKAHAALQSVVSAAGPEPQAKQQNCAVQ